MQHNATYYNVIVFYFILFYFTLCLKQSKYFNHTLNACSATGSVQKLLTTQSSLSE